MYIYILYKSYTHNNVPTSLFLWEKVKKIEILSTERLIKKL